MYTALLCFTGIVQRGRDVIITPEKPCRDKCRCVVELTGMQQFEVCLKVGQIYEGWESQRQDALKCM